MAYCTSEDIQNALPSADVIRLTDDEGAGVINTARLDEAISSAADEMDLYLGQKYALPISVVPAILAKLNIDLAIWNLYGRVKSQIPDMRVERYKNAVAMLDKIAGGKISIGCQPVPDPPVAGGYENPSRVSVRTKDFDATTMEKY